jgi:hypothetical protein
MLKNLTIQKFAMQCEAHGAQCWRQYEMYGDSMSTAQRSNARKDWIGETSNVG